MLRSAGQKVHKSLIKHFVTPVYRFGTDVDAPSFRHLVLLHLGDLLTRPHIKHMCELGCDLFVFCLECRIGHPARLRSKIKIAFPRPKKGMRDLRMGRQKSIEFLGMVDIRKLQAGPLGCLIGALNDPLFRDL